MAKVSLSGFVTSILGKLAGSVFQNSFGGLQVRTRVSPRNPRTLHQQNQRGQFAWFTGSWRNLTSAQRATWIAAAPIPSEAFNLYTSCNLNLAIADQPPITDYTGSAISAQMFFSFDDSNPIALLIHASGLTTTVPANSVLIIYSTPSYPASRAFLNDSNFSPIVTFNEGTDLSGPTSILANFYERWGGMRVTDNISIRAAIVSKINGTRASYTQTTTTVTAP